MNTEIIKGFEAIHFSPEQKKLLRDLPLKEKFEVLAKFYLKFMVEDPIDGTKDDGIVLDTLEKFSRG